MTKLVTVEAAERLVKVENCNKLLQNKYQTNDCEVVDINMKSKHIKDAKVLVEHVSGNQIWVNYKSLTGKQVNKGLQYFVEHGMKEVKIPSKKNVNRQPNAIRKINSIFDQETKLTKDEIIEKLDLSPKTTNMYIKDAHSAGFIEYIGNDTYSLTDNHKDIIEEIGEERELKHNFNFHLPENYQDHGHGLVYLITVPVPNEPFRYYVGKTSDNLKARMDRRRCESKDAVRTFMAKNNITDAYVTIIEDVILDYDARETPKEFQNRLAREETKNINHYKHNHKEWTLNH